MFRKLSEGKTKDQSGAFIAKIEWKEYGRKKLRGSVLKYLKLDEDEPTTSTIIVNSEFNWNSKNEFETEIPNENHRPEVRLDEEIVSLDNDIESRANEENIVDNYLEITTDFDMDCRYYWPPVINKGTIEIVIQRVPVMVQNTKFLADTVEDRILCRNIWAFYETMKKYKEIV